MSRHCLSVICFVLCCYLFWLQWNLEIGYYFAAVGLSHPRTVVLWDKMARIFSVQCARVRPCCDTALWGFRGIRLLGDGEWEGSVYGSTPKITR